MHVVVLEPQIRLMEKFLRTINGYVISLVLLLFGLGFLLKYASGDALESQPTSMLYASLAMIVVGILAMPIVLEKANQSRHARCSLQGCWPQQVWPTPFYSVDEEIQFQATQQRVNATTIQRLKDIRSAQESHLAVYGSFAETFDSLLKFVEAPVVPVEFNMGSFHDTLPEVQSREDGYVIKRAQIAAIAEEDGMSEQELLDLITDDLSPYKVRDVVHLVLR